MCSYKMAALFELQRCGGIAHTTGVLPWKGTGPEGRADCHGKERELPFM